MSDCRDNHGSLDLMFLGAFFSFIPRGMESTLIITDIPRGGGGIEVLCVEQNYLIPAVFFCLLHSYVLNY